MVKPEVATGTVRVALAKPLADGHFIPGVPVDGSAAELDRVYAKGYLDAGLIKEVAEIEAPRPVKSASIEEGV